MNPNQSSINKEWLQTVQSNVGEVGMLVQPRHVTPGLPKRYEYLLDWDVADALWMGLRGAVNRHRQKLQCDLVEKRSLAKGMRLSFFFLGYRPGFCGGDHGITEADWQDLTERVWKHLTISKLPDPKPYIEPWSHDKKFEMRWESWIAIKEKLQ